MKKNCLLALFWIVLFSAGNLRSQTVNVGFESTAPGSYTSANAVSGWSISSQTVSSCSGPNVWTAGSPEFSVIASPFFFPVIGAIGNSPLGGTKVAVLNNSSADNSSTRITRTFNITASASHLQLAFGGVWGNGNHLCCEQASLRINFYDCLGNLIPCSSFSAGGVGCPYVPTYTLNGNNIWANWQVKSIELSSYMSSCITLEVIVSDCALGDHFGTIFFDADISQALICSCPSSNSQAIVNFCAGTSLATIQAPFGNYTYSWTAPPGYPITSSQATLSTLTLTNAIVGNVYTVNLVNQVVGCLLQHTIALATNSVSIAGIGANTTCVGGTGGSATVVPNGSGQGYNYSWINSTNSVVGTSSAAANLVPGNYSVTVTAAGSASATCGSAVAVATVGAGPPVLLNLLKPFCGAAAYLYAPAGSNYQWYSSTLAPIAASLGGTAPGYTLVTPLTSATIAVGYDSPVGCRDSVKFTLMFTTPGNLSVFHNSLICQGASNGTAVVALVPSAGSPPGFNSFSVSSIGTQTPAYVASVNPTAFNTFTVSNLLAGALYSVNAFDGSCYYSKSFSITPLVYNYSLSPAASASLCPGGSVPSSVNFIGIQPGLCTYSWSPTTFLAAGFGAAQNTLITPTASPGTMNTMVYTVVVTPASINCPLTKTIAVTAINPVTPTIATVPPLCDNAPLYTLSANPTGGTFYDNSGAITAGQLAPALALPGAHTFSYSLATGTCITATTETYVILSAPSLSVSGNASICNGQSTTLLASGAGTYTWNLATGASLTVAPTINSSYTVTGTDTITGCHNIKTVTVAVFPLPNLQITGDTLLCPGESTTLTATGADAYSWNTGSPFAVLTATPGATNTFTVLGINMLGSCTNTQQLTVFVDACTKVNTWHAADKVKVYPNPVSYQLSIQVDAELSGLQLELTNTLGELVRTIPPSQNQRIDVSDLRPGIYFLKFQNTERWVYKIVKEN